MEINEIALIRGIAAASEENVADYRSVGKTYRDGIKSLKEEIAEIDARIAEEVCINAGLRAYVAEVRATADDCPPLEFNGHSGPHGEPLCDAQEAYNRSHDDKALEFGRPDLIDQRVQDAAPKRAA